MQNQRQGMHSTKAKAPHPGNKSPPVEIKRDVFINVYEPNWNIYIDQAGKLPLRSSQRNKYQMILHEIYDNTTWIEPMKTR